MPFPTRILSPSGLCTLLTYSILFLSLAFQTASRSEVIETSSVSYCSAPLAIVVDTFDVRYYTSNNSLEFDLSAASVTRGLNLEAHLELNAYGMSALNLSIDLCSVLSGVLCPLPTYNFTGSGAYTIPAANVPSIPGITWMVPDIEAVITVLLVDTANKSPAACLQVTLTNGLTVGLASVSWPTAGVLISTFLLALGQTSQLGLLFILLADQLQHMAMSGMMSLNYPIVFRTWTTNFAYAMGLIPSRPISHAIDRLRALTGGNGFTTAQDLVAFTSRLFSPYNQLSGSVDTLSNFHTEARAQDTFAQSLAAREVQPTSTNPALAKPLGKLITTPPRANYVVPVVTQNTTLLDPGLAAYVNELGFPVENAYMVVFMWAIILVALSLALTAILGLLLNLRSRSSRNWRSSLSDALMYARQPALRALLFAWPPITLFTCWQWHLGGSDAWLPILLSVIVWLASTSGLGWAAWVAIHEGSEGPLAVFKDSRWWAFAPLALITFIKVAVLGFAQGTGERQVIAMIIMEAMRTLFFAFGRPFRQTRWTVAATLMSVLQLVQNCILETFVPRQEVRPIPRAALGFVSIVVQAIAFVFLFGYGVTLAALGAQRILRRRRDGAYPFGSASERLEQDPEKIQQIYDDKPLDAAVQRRLSSDLDHDLRTLHSDSLYHPRTQENQDEQSNPFLKEPETPEHTPNRQRMATTDSLITR